MITRAAAQQDVTGLQDDDLGKQDALQAASREAVELEGRRKFFELRERWSTCIIVWTSCLIAFNCGLALFVGGGALDFEKYQWFVTAVTVETFLQVIGLGYVAVRFLFSEGR